MKTEREIMSHLEAIHHAVQIASDTVGGRLVLTIPNASCCVLRDSLGKCLADGTFQVSKKLAELAMPQKPEKVTITVPYEWAEMRAKESAAGNSAMGIDVNQACAEAVKPYQYPE